MKIVNQPAVMALGAATLCTLTITSPLVSWDHEVVYHLSGSATWLYGAVGLDVLLVWALLTAVLLLAEKSGPLRGTIWIGLCALLSLLSVKMWMSLHARSLSRGMAEAAVGLPLMLIAMLALPPLQRRRPMQWYRGLFATALGFTSVVGFVVLAELLYFGWRARELHAPLKQKSPVIASREGTPHSRIIWIVFDELSFAQIYERRMPGLQLPAFDALADDATVMTRVVPAGIYTEEVLPSLMMGTKVNALNITSSGDLAAVLDGERGTWEPFDPRRTVFEDARERGERTAVVGWYNPYCRILPEVLDRCSWVSHEVYAGHMLAERSMVANMLGPLSSVAALFGGSGKGLWRRLDRSTDIATEHIAEYQELSESADDVLEDGSLGFVMLHLPVPHPRGIYDRRRGMLTMAGASYVDNLALADKCLGHIREELKRRGEWDADTVVVMGDHSWRTQQIWRGTADWTHEDEVASDGGTFDDRPAYVVKLPQQSEGARIEQRFEAVRTRALLDAALDGRLRTVADLRAFVGDGR